MNKKKLAIIGSGDLGVLLAHHATTDSAYEVVGFFDDFRETGSLVCGISVLGSIETVEAFYKDGVFDAVIIAIGYKHLAFREAVYQSLKNKTPMATLIHSSCLVDNTAVIGEGSCLLPGCIIDRNVTLEPNVLVNIGSTIAHDSHIGAHSFLSPRLAIAGFVTVGQRCNLGINTTIIDNIDINDDVQTGGGTVVIKSLTEKGVYVGSPARKIST